MALILAVIFLGQALQLARLHPYQYVYFNALVGGLPGANGRFELDYWAHSFREAALRLSTTVHEELDVGRRYRVVVCGPPQSAFLFLPDTFTRVREIGEADFAIVLRRNLCKGPFKQQEPLFTVGRSGVPFSLVYDLRAEATAAQRHPLSLQR